MEFKVEINIMPHTGLLDPKGKAVAGNMKNINLSEIKDVRIGKHIQLLIEADSKQKAEEIADEACKKLLANAIMETYELQVVTE